ncbi:MAG: T9SS type A sorting domain-containing protein [Bacteroidia bacterium]|nr:T9SS type A sorting domain-containing protein [Bacteroidia bacterium]
MNCKKSFLLHVNPQISGGATFFLFFLIVWFLSNSAFAQVKPYLSSPSDTSIWISWRTDAEKETKVEFGLSFNQMTNIVTGKCDSLGVNYLWHTANLTGLAPDTRYYYRTVSGSEVSGIYSFRTQPPEGTNTGHYRFAIIGDHQVISDDRYERIVRACKNKVIEKYATSPSDTLIEDHLRMLVCDGDQVNVGTLEHYKKMHFGQSSPLMSNIPVMTVVGNHEYNSDPELANYFAHYCYDNISYKGITGFRGEEYYAFQVANILFVMINSNLRDDPDQLSWIEQIVSAAGGDASVDWLFAVNHHPYYCEQMPNDAISSMRESYCPRLAQTEKYAMHIAGHSHLYARGSMRDFPCHLIINGGACFDQYWGQTSYTEYQDVQKTIERQIFQIVDVDLGKREMHVETYSIGTNLFPGITEDRLIDEYYLKLDAPAPEKPAITNPVSEVVLPHVFKGSKYSGQEPLNSVEYQVANEDGDFGEPEFAYKTDFENLFLSTGSPDYIPIDLNAGIDITQMKLDSALFTSGKKFFRFRYRDQSLHWSPWSDTVSFTILNGKPVPPNYPVLRYKLDGNTYEYMGSGLNGMPGFSGSFIFDSEHGEVANFNNNAIITLSSGNTEKLSLPTQSVSVSCWVKLNSVDFWGGFVGLFQDNGDYEKGWVLGTFDDSFSFALTTGSKINYLKASGVAINPGEWYYIAGTYDGMTQKIYVNGELKGSATLGGEISYPPTGWFQIGAYKDDNEDFRHDGCISDVIIWTGALSSQKVKKLYHKTMPLYAIFDAGKTEISAGKYVEFDDLSQFSPQSWHWYFEGGTPETSTEQNPVVFYEKPGVYNVTLVAENAFGMDSLLKEKYITVGITNTETLEIDSSFAEIFPNPADKMITISLPAERIFNVKIFNAVGILLKSFGPPMSTKTIVDVSGFPEGLYFIKIESEDESVVRKFVKVHP